MTAQQSAVGDVNANAAEGPAGLAADAAAGAPENVGVAQRAADREGKQPDQQCDKADTTDESERADHVVADIVIKPVTESPEEPDKQPRKKEDQQRSESQAPKRPLAGKAMHV